METKSIFIIGPQGIDRSQILENLTTRKGIVKEGVLRQSRAPASTTPENTTGQKRRSRRSSTSGDRNRPPADNALSMQNYNDNVLSMKVWSTPVLENQPINEVLERHNYINADAVLLVIDDKIINDNKNMAVTIQFLSSIHQCLPHAKIKLIVKVNEVETETLLNIGEIENIKPVCNEKIRAAANLLTDFNIEQDIIYYSAEQEAKAIQSSNRSFQDDPIIQSLGFYPAEVFIDPPIPLPKNEGPEWNVIWAWLKLKLKPVVRILLFTLLVALLTAVFGAIGFGIGAAAGAWCGLGAFLTAIAGVFAGAVTAWNLSVLIAAPVLGLTVGYWIWHQRSPQDPSFSLIEDTENHEFSFFSTDFSGLSNKPNPGLMVNYSPRVVGDPQSTYTSQTKTTSPYPPLVNQELIKT